MVLDKERVEFLFDKPCKFFIRNTSGKREFTNHSQEEVQ